MLNQFARGEQHETLTLPSRCCQSASNPEQKTSEVLTNDISYHLFVKLKNQEYFLKNIHLNLGGWKLDVIILKLNEITFIILRK